MNAKRYDYMCGGNNDFPPCIERTDGKKTLNGIIIICQRKKEKKSSARNLKDINGRDNFGKTERRTNIGTIVNYKYVVLLGSFLAMFC